MNPYEQDYQWYLKQVDEYGEPFVIAYANFWLIIKDDKWVKEIIQNVLKDNPKTLTEYKKPKRRKKTFGFLMGRIMNETLTINPNDARKILTELLDQL